jgi:hypothetical protein
MAPTRFRPLLPLLAALLVLGGCSSTLVQLEYKTVATQTPYCGDRRITVVPFEDATSKRAIGTNRKGQPVFSETAVEKWATRALQAQLKSEGCPVLRSKRAKSGFAVTGRVLEVALQEVSATMYNASLKLEVALWKGGTRGEEIYRETFASRVQKRTIPGIGSGREVMTETMQELLRDLVPTLVQRIRQAG